MSGAAAYKQLQPLRDTVSQTLNQLGSIEAQKLGAEKQRRFVEGQSITKQAQEDLKSATDFKVSGNKSHDQIKLEYGQMVGQNYLKEIRAQKEAVRRGDREAASKHGMNASLIMNGMRSTKKLLDQGSEIIINELKKISEGKANPLEEQLPMMAADISNGNYTLKPGKNGLATIVFSNGKEVALQDIVNGNIKSGDKFDIMGETDKIGEKLGLRQWDEISKGYKITRKELSPQAMNRLDYEIDMITSDPVKLSQTLYAATNGQWEFKNNDFSQLDEKGMAIVKAKATDYLKKTVLGAVDTEEKVTADPKASNRLAWEKFKYQKDRDKYLDKVRLAQKNTKKDITSMIPMAKISGVKSDFEGEGFTLGKPITLSSSAKIDAIYVKEGTLMIRPYQPKTTDELNISEAFVKGGLKFEAGEMRPATTTEANIIANSIVNPESPEGATFGSADRLARAVGVKINGPKKDPVKIVKTESGNKYE